MRLPDVNVLIAAHRADHPDHAENAAFLERLVAAGQPFGLSELVLSAFVRIVTRHGIFDPPTPQADAFEFISELTECPEARLLRPGLEHWQIFVDLCRATGVTGGRVADAYHAALAIEHGCELISSDGDFARFPGLRWSHPQAKAARRR